MTLQQLGNTYDTLNKIFSNRIVFAIGGYHSLVLQSVLPEYRPINDIDINVVVPKDQEYSFSRSRIVESFREIAHKYNEDRANVMRMTLDTSEKKMSVYSEDSELVIVPEYSTEFSVTIQLVKKDAQWFKEEQGYFTYRSKISSGYFGWNPFENPSERSHQIVKCGRSDVEQIAAYESVPELEQILLYCPGNRLKIDCFAMESKNINNKIFIHDGQILTHYYPILAAKHAYCLNKNTNDVSFAKHIHDLILSRTKVPIRGINYQEDIDKLIRIRRELISIPNGESK